MYRKVFIALALGGLLIGCGGDQKTESASNEVEKQEIATKAVSIPADAKQEDKAFFSEFYPKVEKACPGLKQYAAGLQFDGIEYNYNTDFVFKIPQDDKTLPTEWMVFGHSCYFGITKDKGSLSVSKLPCKSLCLGEAIEEGSDVDLNENLEIPFK